MFSAMILACAIDAKIDEDLTECKGFVSYHLWQTEEQCMSSLQVGIAEVDIAGWIVIDYQCFDWAQKKGIKL